MGLASLDLKGDLEMAYRLIRLLGVSLVCLASGCATLSSGKYQRIEVTSEPTGAKIRTTNGLSLLTPGSLHFLPNEDYILVAEYPGCKAQLIELKYKPPGLPRGSTPLGRIIGGGVDLILGSKGTLTPNSVHFDFSQSELSDAPPT